MKKLIKIFISIVLFFICTVSYFSRFNVIKNYGLYIVESNSMSPSIKRGDLLISSKLDSYKVSDVITFTYPYDVNKLISHRITEVTFENGPIGGQVVFYKTKGDANSTIDPWQIKNSYIKGKVFFLVPFIGYLVFFIRHPIGYLLTVVVFCFLALSESNDIFLETLRWYKSLYRYFGIKIIKYKNWLRRFKESNLYKNTTGK